MNKMLLFPLIFALSHSICFSSQESYSPLNASLQDQVRDLQDVITALNKENGDLEHKVEYYQAEDVVLKTEIEILRQKLGEEKEKNLEKKVIIETLINSGNTTLSDEKIAQLLQENYILKDKIKNEKNK